MSGSKAGDWVEDINKLGDATKLGKYLVPM